MRVKVGTWAVRQEAMRGRGDRGAVTTKIECFVTVSREWEIKSEEMKETYCSNRT